VAGELGTFGHSVFFQALFPFFSVGKPVVFQEVGGGFFFFGWELFIFVGAVYFLFGWGRCFFWFWGGELFGS